MADITPDIGAWSSTAGSNSPSGATNIGTGLDDNLRAIQAAIHDVVTNLTSVAGTNTITATMANLTAYYTGLRVAFIPANTNTGATTINITSLGAKNVFNNGSACIGGELKANVPVVLIYDGTQFNIVGQALASGTTASTFTFDGSGGSSGSLTMEWQRRGNFVTLFLPTIQATSGTGSVTLSSNTALPAGVRPSAATQYQLSAPAFNNGVGIAPPALVGVNTSGIVTINRDGIGTAFTNSTLCGTGGPTTVSYYAG